MNLSTADKLILQQFFAGKPIKKAYLFGSYARNEADSKSDIDIMVELDYNKPIGMKFFTYHEELEELLQKKVDLVSTDGISRHVRPFVDKDKILIYERANDLPVLKKQFTKILSAL
jgi:predicted nucleotidyltransferase